MNCYRYEKWNSYSNSNKYSYLIYSNLRNKLNTLKGIVQIWIVDKILIIVVVTIVKDL